MSNKFDASLSPKCAISVATLASGEGSPTTVTPLAIPHSSQPRNIANAYLSSVIAVVLPLVLTALVGCGSKQSDSNGQSDAATTVTAIEKAKEKEAVAKRAAESGNLPGRAAENRTTESKLADPRTPVKQKAETPTEEKPAKINPKRSSPEFLAFCETVEGKIITERFAFVTGRRFQANTIDLDRVTKQYTTEFDRINAEKKTAVDLAISAGKTTEATMISERFALLYDLKVEALGDALKRLTKQFDADIESIWSQHEVTIVQAMKDHAIKVKKPLLIERNEPTFKERTTLKGHSHQVNQIAFSPDGKTLASGSADKTIKLWDVASGTERATLKGHSHSVHQIAFSPNGKTLTSGSADKTIRLWDVATGTEQHTFQVHIPWRYWVPIAYSPDGKTLASGSTDNGLNSIRLWDVATGKVQAILMGHTFPVDSVAFSPDGKTLASGSGDNTIRLWDLATGKVQAILRGHTFSVWSVAYSPDGKTLASGSSTDHSASEEDASIKLWDVTTGKEQFRLKGHTGAVDSVAFSPDGKTLASKSNSDKTVKLWNVATGKELATLMGHTEAVSSVAFSPDGKTLASASGDKTIKLWELAIVERKAAEAARREGKEREADQSKAISEITADFLPHTPGTTYYYDAQMISPDGKACVIRRKVTQEADGIINSTMVRVGALGKGESIVKGDKVTWLMDINVPSLSPVHHRIKGDYIEIGNTTEGVAGIQWEPVLKIGAKDGDTWKCENADRTAQYKVEFGATHAGRPAVVIHITMTEPLTMTQTRTYVKGIGQIEQISVWSVKNGKKETAIIKLVEEAKADLKQEDANDRKQAAKVEPEQVGQLIPPVTKPDPKQEVIIEPKEKPKVEPKTEPKQVEPMLQPVLNSVTLVALNTESANYDAQTLTVRGNLSGTMYQGKGRCRLTVNGARTVADGEKLRLDGINFVIQNEETGRLMAGMKPDQFYPVKLTVTVKQGVGGHWFAVVSEIERE